MPAVHSTLVPELPTKRRRCHPPRAIRVGTDCSGLDAPLFSLNDLGVPYHHVFSCEKDKSCQKIIKHCHDPDILYTDITTRQLADVPYVDVFVFGFPCQSFSGLGQGQVLARMIQLL